MAEVDYLRYAQLMGTRNPMAEGLSSLGDTLDKGYAQKRQNMLDQRQMRLSDLQMQREQMALSEAQRDQEYKQGLRDRMANPQTTTQFTPKPTVAPALQTAPTALQPQPEFTMPQPETSPAVQAYNEGRVKSSTESPAAAGAKFAMSQGRPEEAAKMISVDDALAQYGAKIQAGGGDPKQYYAAKADLDQAKEVASIIHAYKDQPEVLKTMWPSIVKLVPKAATMDPFNAKAEQDGILIPFKTQQGETVKGKYYYYDSKKQMHIMEDKPDPMEMMVKRDELAGARQDKQIAAADERLNKTIAAADARAARPKPEPPGKVLPAGQVEAIADMKRVKDVLAEAGKLANDKNITTGPVSGRLQSLGSKVGMASEDFTNFNQKLATAENIMLKLRSGAAVTDQEFERFKREFPNVNDPPAVRNRKLNNATKYATELMDSKLDLYEESGYKVPKSAKSTNAGKPANRPPLSAIFGK